MAKFLESFTVLYGSSTFHHAIMDIKTMLRINKGNFQPNRRFEGGEKYSVLDSTLSIHKCEQVGQKKLNFCQQIITKTEQ